MEGTVSAMEPLVKSLVDGLTNIAGDMLNAIGAVVPAALPILGGVAVIGIAIGVFKKVAHK